MCGSYVSVVKRLSHIKLRLMNLIATKLHVENPSFKLVYAVLRATREQILKIFDPDLIHSDLWLCILKFFSQRKLPRQLLLKRFQRFLLYNSGKESLFMLYVMNIMSSFFRIQSQSNPSLKEQNSSVFSLLLVLSKVTVLMYGIFLYATIQMVVLRLKVFILISHAVQWHMLIPS